MELLAKHIDGCEYVLLQRLVQRLTFLNAVQRCQCGTDLLIGYGALEFLQGFLNGQLVHGDTQSLSNSQIEVIHRGVAVLVLSQIGRINLSSPCFHGDVMALYLAALRIDHVAVDTHALVVPRLGRQIERITACLGFPVLQVSQVTSHLIILGLDGAFTGSVDILHIKVYGTCDLPQDLLMESTTYLGHILTDTVGTLTDLLCNFLQNRWNRLLGAFGFLLVVFARLSLRRLQSRL